jgi:hypothetical protein
VNKGETCEKMAFDWIRTREPKYERSERKKHTGQRKQSAKRYNKDENEKYYRRKSAEG